MKTKLLIVIVITILVVSASIGIDQAYALCIESDGPPEPCFDSFQVSNEKITEKSMMENYARNIELNYDDWQMSDRIFENSLEAYDLPDIICTEFVVDGVKQYRMAQWVNDYKISSWEDHYNPSLCFKWLAPISNSMPIPEPDLRASCAFDGVIAMWFYQFIVNPLCEMDIQIIPDYECNCDI